MVDQAVGNGGCAAPPVGRTHLSNGDASGENPFAIGMPACDVSCQPSPFHYPDEYLCDGGDRYL